MFTLMDIDLCQQACSINTPKGADTITNSYAGSACICFVILSSRVLSVIFVIDWPR